MKAKWVIFLVGAGVLTMILLTGYPSAAAAPAGEIKILAPFFGDQVPVPRLEQPHGMDYMQMLYDHLVGTTADGKLSTEMGVANKWEMSPDGLTWTFYLRKGVKFHDGVELTAKDVKFSIEQTLLPDCKAAYKEEIKGTIKGIEVKDPYTLVIHCKKPSIFLVDLLSDKLDVESLIIPKDYYERVGQDQFIKKPVGSGPYKFVSQMVGSHIKLEAIDRHWRDGVPRYKYITYLLIPEESTRLAMLRTGEGDITRISREAVKGVLDAGLSVIFKEKATIIYFSANMQWTSPVFSDIRFRKALNLAIDKESIIKHIFAGMGTRYATYPYDNTFTCGGDPKLEPYPYDPKEAKRLIKEGGYEGHEFTVPVFPRSGCPEYPQMIEAVAGYWQQIGLKPKIFTTEYSVWRIKRNAKQIQNSIHGLDANSDIGCSGFVERSALQYHSKSIYALVQNPYLDEKFEKIHHSLNPAEVAKLLGEVHRYAYDQYLVIPICEIPDVIATTQRIPKWDPGSRRFDRNLRALIQVR